MTRTQKIQVRQSELRQEIATLLDVESEKRAEDHEARMTDSKLPSSAAWKTDLQAAILTEEPEEKPEEKDPETREHESLAERCDVGAIFAAAIEHRATGGTGGRASSSTTSSRLTRVPLDHVGDEGGNSRAERRRPAAGPDYPRRIPPER